MTVPLITLGARCLFVVALPFAAWVIASDIRNNLPAILRALSGEEQ